MACPQLLRLEVSGGGLWVQFVMLLDFFVRWRRRLRGTRIGHCQRGPENNSTLINNDLSPGPTQKIGKGACVTCKDSRICCVSSLFVWSRGIPITKFLASFPGSSAPEREIKLRIFRVPGSLGTRHLTREVVDSFQDHLKMGTRLAYFS